MASHKKWYNIRVILKDASKKYLPAWLVGGIVAIKLLWKCRRIRKSYRPVDRTSLSIHHMSSVRVFEARYFSQNGEDGLIDALFTDIGPVTCTFVEFGFGATMSNSIWLALQWKFGGLFIDCNLETCKIADSAYSWLRRTDIKIANEFLTATNINRILQAHGVTGEIDMLTIDIDGNDYWVWEAINVISPRVVVIEYNDVLGPEKAISIPYNPQFVAGNSTPYEIFSGASLRALEILGEKKEYKLIGVESEGVNAIFLRNDVKTSNFNKVNARDVFRYQRRTERSPIDERKRVEIIGTLPFINVE